MKFNERNVAYFANCNSPVDREGWLLKRGELHRGFQKRWFILKGNLLFYFEKKGDKDPVGVIILEGCRVELADSEDSMFTFQLSFPGEGARTYVLAGFNQEEMEAWMRALSCSSYDYMKAMVDELQRQLDELTHHTHGEGVVQQGRFSYAPGGSDEFVLLGADGSDNGKAAGVYERGKTESLAHKGAPRPNAFQRNSLPVSQFSNPSYAIWDPLVPKEEDEDNEEARKSSSSSSQNFLVDVTPPGNGDSSDDEGNTITEREKFMGKSALLAQQLEASAVQSRQPSTAPGASRRGTQAKSVFYENVTAAEAPKPITRGVSARARLVNRIAGGQSNQSSGVESKKAGHSIFHDSDIRGFREMHEQFGLLIVKKINQARQRKMSST
ncbi:uncharacterized protein [Amphiura filiformis]|uniref:uncharacterized protein n=1 Tax=Amphiura filiformis TaxID=82378 RepID=UPI003B21D2D9